jgi:3-dehydroquinate dehydratase II
MNLMVINGPNINMLGIREPAIYGTETYQDLQDMIKVYCDEKGIAVDFYQSNSEGDLVSAIQNAWRAQVGGIVLNAAAYTHTSIAILDALKATAIPAVEVHISNVKEREEFRHISRIKEGCIATVEGKGLPGYIEAIDILCAYLQEK